MRRLFWRAFKITVLFSLGAASATAADGWAERTLHDKVNHAIHLLEDLARSQGTPHQHDAVSRADCRWCIVED